MMKKLWNFLGDSRVFAAILLLNALCDAFSFGWMFGLPWFIALLVLWTSEDKDRIIKKQSELIDKMMADQESTLRWLQDLHREINAVAAPLNKQSGQVSPLLLILLATLGALGFALFTANWLAVTGFVFCLFLEYTCVVIGRDAIRHRAAIERGLPVLKQAAAIIREAEGRGLVASQPEENKQVLH